jgi:hypothetical protein
MMGVILTVTYFLARRVFKNSEIGIISLIMTSTMVMFYLKAMEVRPDIPQSLAGLVSIYFLFVFYDNKSKGSLIASAVFLAVSFLILQKAIALIFVIGILFLYDLYGKRIRVREVLIYAGTFLLTVSPYYIYLFIQGSLEKYFVLNWILNMNLRSTQGLSRFELLSEMLQENLVTCMFYVIGVVILIRSNKYRQFVLVSLGLFIVILIIYKHLWAQYFIMAIPLLGIIASYAMYSTFKSNVSKFVVIMFAIYMPISMMHDYGSIIRNRGFDNADQTAKLEKINYVLSITDKDDKVYDGDIQFNLFRDDIDYFWFCMETNDCLDVYKKIAGYEYDIYELISIHKPKVISTYNIFNLDDERIKNYYKPSEKYPDILIRVEE